MDAKKKNKITVCDWGTEYYNYQTHIRCSWPNVTVLSCIDSDLPILALHIVHFASTMHVTFLYWQLCILLISFGYCSLCSRTEKKNVFKDAFVQKTFCEKLILKKETKEWRKIWSVLQKQCLINSTIQSSVKSMYLRC